MFQWHYQTSPSNSPNIHNHPDPHQNGATSYIPLNSCSFKSLISEFQRFKYHPLQPLHPIVNIIHQQRIDALDGMNHIRQPEIEQRYHHGTQNYVHPASMIQMLQHRQNDNNDAQQQYKGHLPHKQSSIVAHS